MTRAPTRWLARDDGRRELYSPIGIRLVDDFAAGPPLDEPADRREPGSGPPLVELADRLDVRPAGAAWRRTNVRAVRTPSGVLTYPALGRSRDPGGPPVEYRFRVAVPYPKSLPPGAAAADDVPEDARAAATAAGASAGGPEWYLPEYLSTAHGLTFDAHPYDDDHPPAVIPAAPRDVILFPGPNYPFPPHVPVIRGRVVDGGGVPVPFAEVSWGGSLERTLTDRRGAFALALRWASDGEPLELDALQPAGAWHGEERTGELPGPGDPPLTFPAALRQQHTITIRPR